jgi:transcriptional regulator with XRE-family HTH domain
MTNPTPDEIAVATAEILASQQEGGKRLLPAKEARLEDIATTPPDNRLYQQLGVRMRYNYPGATNFEGERDYMLVRERPIESVRRRLKELALPQKKMAEVIGISERHLSMALSETTEISRQTLYAMLDYVGMQEVAVESDNIALHDRDGHWYYGERCQYCGVNVYDNDMYNDSGICEENPTLKESM